MSEGVDRGQRHTLPLACSLGPDDGPTRLWRWQRLFEAAAPTASVADGSLEVRFRPGPGVWGELRELVAEERVCCAFATWSVLRDGEQPVVTVTAPPGRPEAIAPIVAWLEAATGRTLEELGAQPAAD